MVRRWVVWYQLHGTDGLNKKSSRYSPAFKLSVLQHMWDTEMSSIQTAALFNIRSTSSIAGWIRDYRNRGPSGLNPGIRGRPKKMAAPTTKPEPSPDDEKRTREELLGELNYLRMENAYLKKLRALVQAQQKAALPKKR